MGDLGMSAILEEHINLTMNQKLLQFMGVYYFYGQVLRYSANTMKLLSAIKRLSPFLQN